MLSHLLIFECIFSSTSFSVADIFSFVCLNLLVMHSTVLFILFIECSLPIFLLLLFSRISICSNLPDFFHSFCWLSPLQYGLNYVLFHIVDLFIKEGKKQFEIFMWHFTHVSVFSSCVEWWSFRRVMCFALVFLCFNLWACWFGPLLWTWAQILLSSLLFKSQSPVPVSMEETNHFSTNNIKSSKL